MKVIDIVSIIEVCAKLSGFGRDLEEDEHRVLVSQLVTNKGYLKGAEVKTAFDCAFNGELEIKGDDLKPYNQFSWLYLARIVTAYERKVQQGKLIQDISEVIKEPATTPEDIINGKKYIVEQIIEQFTRGEDHDFGVIGNTDLHIVNLVFDTLKEFGYSFGEPSELRTLYVEQRKNELTRSEYWRKQKQRGAFAEYKDKNFMTKHKEAMNRNVIHRTVAKRCRMLSVQKFYDEQKEFDLDLVNDIQERFEGWVVKFKAQ